MTLKTDLHSSNVQRQLILLHDEFVNEAEKSFVAFSRAVHSDENDDEHFFVELVLA